MRLRCVQNIYVQSAHTILAFLKNYRLPKNGKKRRKYNTRHLKQQINQHTTMVWNSRFWNIRRTLLITKIKTSQQSNIQLFFKFIYNSHVYFYTQKIKKKNLYRQFYFFKWTYQFVFCTQFTGFYIFINCTYPTQITI